MKWEELSMSDRSNLMKTYLQNGVTQLSDMRDHYNKFVSGGPLRDEYDNPDQYYDYRTAEEVGDMYDPKSKHWASRDPRTGMILKNPKHPTFGMAIREDKADGYSLYIDSSTGRYYTLRPGEYATSPYKPTLRRVNSFYGGGAVDLPVRDSTQPPVRPIFAGNFQAQEQPEYTGPIVGEIRADERSKTQKFFDKIRTNYNSSSFGNSAVAEVLSATTPYGLIHEGAAGNTDSALMSAMPFGARIKNLGNGIKTMYKAGRAVTSKLVPSNRLETIESVIKKIDKGKKVDTNNLYELIQSASDADLDKLVEKINRFDGELGMIPALARTRKPVLSDNFSTYLNDVFYKLRHIKEDSEFIRKSTATLRDYFDKYMKAGGNNSLYISQNTPSIETTVPKYISHAISESKLRRAIRSDINGAIMPSLAILPRTSTNNFNTILFVGDKSLLGKSKVYSGDAWTPRVDWVQDYASKTPIEILAEMKKMKPVDITHAKGIQELTTKEALEKQFIEKVVDPEFISSNVFTKFFYENAPVKKIPSTTPYLEAKYQELLPFGNFQHALIPEEATDIIEWANKNNLPYTPFSFYNTVGKKTREVALQEFFDTHPEILFKLGGDLSVGI